MFKKLHDRRVVQYGYPLSAMGKRVLAAAAMYTVKCAKCGAVASTGVVYKKCAGCREARYCSRECQISHWSTHALDCRVMVSSAKMLSTVGYIACDNNKCKIVDAYTSSKHHSACSRCASVFYCSKKCQKAAWQEHKLTCVPFRK